MSHNNSFSVPWHILQVSRTGRMNIALPKDFPLTGVLVMVVAQSLPGV